MKVVATLSLSSTFNYHLLSCIVFFIIHINLRNILMFTVCYFNRILILLKALRTFLLFIIFI